MADSFDPYHKWLGISPKDQPPHHYRLLGIELFESDPDVIEGAADQRMSHVRTFQTGQNSALSQRILNELSAAKLCLLTPQKKADYDRQLRQKIEREKAPNAPAGAPSDSSVGSALRGVPGAAGAAPSPRPMPQAKPLQTAPLPLEQPLPQAAPLPVMEEAAPVIVAEAGTSASSIHRRPNRKTPVWRQPAMLGMAGALVLFGLVAYFLSSSGKSNREVAVPNRDQENNTVKTAPPATQNAAPSNTEKPAKTTPGPSGSNAAATPATIEPPTTTSVSSQGHLEIVAATWGTGDKWVDVTEGVRGVVKDNRLMMIVWSDLFGKPEDPAPGVGKKLRVRYRSREKEYAAEYFDSWFVYLDGNPLAPPTDSPNGLELLEARYGAGGTFVDVLPQLAPRLAAGRLSVAADEFAATTAAELEKHGIGQPTFKVLWVRYRDHTGDHFDYAWNSQLLTIDTRLPPAAGRPVDLLRLIEVPRDVVYGDWSMKDGKLLAPAQIAARVQIPYRIPSDYALKVVVESDGQLAEVSTGLVVGGHQVITPVDSGGDSSFSGLALLRGLWHGDYQNPTKTWRLAHMLEQGRSNTLTYIVRPTSVRVLRDGAEIVRWSGDPAIFSIPDNWKVLDPQKLYLQSYNFPYRITKVELTPLAPDTTPMLTLGESGPPVDVQQSIDLERDRLHGDWQYDGQALVSPADDIRARLRLPAIVPDSYQLDLVVQRESGNGLMLTVPVAGTEGTLCLDFYEGKISGLQKIDDQLIDKNETRYDGAIFADGKRHLVRLTVRKNHVRVVCDGKPIVDWTGDVSRLKSTESLPYHDRIYVGAWQARYRLTQIKLRALRGDEPDEMPPALASGSVDLLRQIDVVRDRVNGDWTSENAELRSPKKSAARVQLPFAPDGDYELTVVAERLSGTDSFILGLVIDGQQVAMSLDGYGGETSGLADLDHRDGAENETTRRGRRLPPGKPHTIVCTVHGNDLRVTCDGQQVLAWSGDASRLSNSVFWEVPDKRRLFLGAWDSEFKYTRIEVKSLPRHADTKMAKPPEPKLSDPASGKSPRAPLPDEAAQRQAKQGLLKRIATAKSPEQKRKLAQQFLEEALLAGAAEANVYVLLSLAADLAEACGDLDLAWQAIDQLAHAFAVDADDLRQKSLSEIAKTAKSPQRCGELVDAACRLMVSALVAGEPEIVKKAAGQAQSLAKRSKDKTLQKDVNGRAAGAAKVAGDIAALAAARETLKTTPDDPHANFVVGHWELCVENDWEPAIVKLMNGDDAGWKKLAADSRPLMHDLSDWDLQVATADAWWDKAEQEPWPGRHYLRLHAANWYRLAVPSLVGEKRAHAEERLKLLLATDEGLPAWELFDGGQTVDGFRRITRGGSMRTRVAYDGPIDVTFVARTDSLNIRLTAYDQDVVIWNWELNPSELRVSRPDGRTLPAPVTPLEPNRWYEFHYRITRQGTIITVDGAPVFTENQVYGKFPRSPVGVTGWGNAVIDVKKLVVTALE